MTTQERERAKDDAAIWVAASQAGSGCLLPIVVAALFVFLGTSMVTAMAHAQPAPVYPQLAYTLDDPLDPAHLLLATQDERWTVQAVDPTCLTSYTEVMLPAPVEAAPALIVVSDGRQCALDPSVRIFRQSIGCATRDGVCDVDHEPRPEWFDLP